MSGQDGRRRRLPMRPSIGAARSRAQVLAEILAGEATTLWYDQWAATSPACADVILPLANERGVRAMTGAHGEPALIHATTAPQWTAELHLHRFPSVLCIRQGSNLRPVGLATDGSYLPVVVGRSHPSKLVHLSHHPEVTVCIRCAHSISKWAWEIEDQSRTGIAVRARDEFRRLRKSVVQRGWHHSPLIGRPVRWIGKHTP